MPAPAGCIAAALFLVVVMTGCARPASRCASASCADTLVASLESSAGDAPSFTDAPETVRDWVSALDQRCDAGFADEQALSACRHHLAFWLAMLDAPEEWHPSVVDTWTGAEVRAAEDFRSDRARARVEVARSFARLRDKLVRRHGVILRATGDDYEALSEKLSELRALTEELGHTEQSQALDARVAEAERRGLLARATALPDEAARVLAWCDLRREWSTTAPADAEALVAQIWSRVESMGGRSLPFLETGASTCFEGTPFADQVVPLQSRLAWEAVESTDSAAQRLSALCEYRRAFPDETRASEVPERVWATLDEVSSSILISFLSHPTSDECLQGSRYVDARSARIDSVIARLLAVEWGPELQGSLLYLYGAADQSEWRRRACEKGARQVRGLDAEARMEGLAWYASNLSECPQRDGLLRDEQRRAERQAIGSGDVAQIYAYLDVYAEADRDAPRRAVTSLLNRRGGDITEDEVALFERYFPGDAAAARFRGRMPDPCVRCRATAAARCESMGLSSRPILCDQLTTAECASQCR